MVTLQQTNIREKDLCPQHNTELKTSLFFFFFSFVAQKSQSRASQGYIFTTKLYPITGVKSFLCMSVAD